MPTDRYNKYGILNDEEEARRIAEQEQEEQQTAPVAPTTPVTPAQEIIVGEQPARRGYTDILDEIQREIDSRKVETEEQRKKREKREKTQAVIAGIADIGSALGNMVHAYHGGKSTFDPTQGMSPRYKELWEKNKAEREKNATERMNYLMMRDKLESARAAAEQAQEFNDAKLEIKRRELDLKAEKLMNAKSESEWKQGIEEAKLEVQRQRLAIQDAYNKGRLGIAQSKAETERLNKVDHRLAEYEENYEYDPISGKVTKKVRTVKNPDGTTTTSTTTVQSAHTNGNGKKALPNGKKPMPK